MDGYKHCSKCKETKPVTEFSRDRASKSGYCSHCKACQSSHKHVPNKTCEVCGTPFYAAPGRVARGEARFCSRSCSAKNQESKVARTCEVCGRSFLRRKSAISAGRGRFCSKRCEGEWRSAEHNHRWAGDCPSNSDNTGHKRAQMWYQLRPCEVCGATPEETMIHRHHRDENPMNNAAENICFLCSKHHKLLHLELRKAG